MSLTNTPSANRLQIGIFGKRNSGKSSLINALTNQDIALVSDVAGTTTDPVYKAMEIHGIGPCMFIDTAGFDDTGELGKMRVEKTKDALKRTDVAIVVFADSNVEQERAWVDRMKESKTPVIAVINKADILENAEEIRRTIQEAFLLEPILVSAKTKEGISQLREAIIRDMPADFEMKSITAHLVHPGDSVLLVMPQDIQAPKGRLILPQVQTIRDLLDHECIVMSCTADRLQDALDALAKPPVLIITDSQAFKLVYEKKPPESLLTSFSVLFAEYKGDIRAFVEGAAAIDALTENSHVLIAEACAHAPLAEDIGREKIPRMLRQRVGQGLTIDIVHGVNFPQDLSCYDLIIHCGACMFNRKYVLSRIEAAKAQGVAISNYGVAMAKLTGILDKISY